jgi:HK97 family phage portal protein
MGLRDLLFGKRDTLTQTTRLIGFPSDGGLTAGGVSATTTLGLSSVWACLNVLANGISQLEWRERMGTLDIPPSRVVLRPQAQRTRREWTSLVVSTLALFDVCYLLKAGGTDDEGVPMGLWFLDPTIVTPGAVDVFTTAFLLPPDRFFIAQQEIPRGELVILHRSPQPTISDTAGGIINLARTTFAAAIAAERYASRYWQAGGPPTTVLETDQRLTPTQVEETSEAWSAKRSRGPDYAPVLMGGLSAKSFGADPTSESAVEARRELVADIGRYFGVPTRILNAPTGDSETYTSTSAANQDLVRYTLQNYIGAIEDGISEVLPPSRRMEMDTRKLTTGTQYEQAQAYQLATANRAWMTAQEVRDEVGLPPLEDPTELEPPVKVTERLNTPAPAGAVGTEPPPPGRIP